MTKVRCKRCNHVLTNKESIKLGYGKKCFKIVEMNKKQTNIKDDMAFLKLEVKMLKKLINELKIHGIKQNDTIERLKQVKTEIHTTEKVNMSNVVSELKEIFNKTNGNFKSILKPINPDFYI